MKILITGVAGFLGSHLSQKFADLGHEVIGVDNMIGGYKDNVPKNIKFYPYDCCDLDKMYKVMSKVKVDVVYHCAATAHEGLSVFSPYKIIFVLVIYEYHAYALIIFWFSIIPI